MSALTRVVRAASLAAPLAMTATLFAEVPKTPAEDLSMNRTQVKGLVVRFVDYHWQRDLFEAMAKGSRDVQAARRDWVLARLIVDPYSLRIEKTVLLPASYALALFPKRNDEEMAVEIRRVDVRELVPALDVMAPTPAGETVYRAPARFEVQDPPAPRLHITAVEEARDIVLTIRYGDRRMSLRLTR